MPPKPNPGVKANTVVPEPAVSKSAPSTVNERSLERYNETNPIQQRVDTVGISGLTDLERNTYFHSNLVQPVSNGDVVLSAKAERDFWKQVNKEGLSAHRLRKGFNWGTDKNGRDVGAYTFDEFDLRGAKQARLVALDVAHRHFLIERELAQAKGETIDAEVLSKEKKRRHDMAALKRELYGEIEGSLAQDPQWDDVIPIPLDEPEDALAQIAYPDDYAEAVAYLRAVMAVEELSPRCLRLTEHVISMNPAHYTVWLYRFKIVTHLAIPIPEEIEWLNEVALSNLKNYQIWHHRQLLLNYYYPTIESDPAAVKSLGRSEIDFVSTILQEDTKNYHVWSYRHHLVSKLGLWNLPELLSTQNLIEDDLRNNSAWSHRFFVVFDDPKLKQDGESSSTSAVVPDDLLDREVKYAQDKLLLAPQNQSAWNYLRGTLTRGGRPLGTIQGFAEQFVSALGEEAEEVRSSHALDVLAEIYADQGDADKARLCLSRLSERWDPVRQGYWKYRISQLES